jgi:hypothetical protein
MSLRLLGSISYNTKIANINAYHVFEQFSSLRQSLPLIRLDKPIRANELIHEVDLIGESRAPNGVEGEITQFNVNASNPNQWIEEKSSGMPCDKGPL